jgi:DNA-binding winged helix-turn-helix (wHTH) protein/TolA-binding protein
MRYKINDFSYNDSNGVAYKEQEEFQLTKIQKKLFDYFIAHPKTTLSKQILMDEVWGRTVTENSIEKTLSKLRSVIEKDPLNPEILITHFGHGISFEGSVREIIAKESKTESSRSVKSNKRGNKYLLYTLPLLAIVLMIWKFYPNTSTQFIPELQVQSLKKQQRLIILPMTFDDITQSMHEERGLFEYIKTFFTNLDSEQQILFDENSRNSKDAMEKLWQIDQDLVMMQTDVVKNGEVYDAVVEFSKGMNTIKTVKISAPTLDELAQAQINVVEEFRGNKQNFENSVINNDYLNALALVKKKNYKSAKDLLMELLKKDDKDYQARFLLSRVLFIQKEYEKSLVQLETLKQTIYYKSHSAEIELQIADNLFKQNKTKEIISQLTDYLNQHIAISYVKKAKIKIKLANAHMRFGNNLDALTLFKQALLKIDEKLYPKLYAESFRGQAHIKALNSIGSDVYVLYDKALEYSKQAGDIVQQAKILDDMSTLLLHNNNWEKGLQLKKESLALVEQAGDKQAVANGLVVLADYLINRGLFVECRKILNRLKNIADELDNDALRLAYNHFNISLEMNYFRHDYCQAEIDKQFKLARNTNNLSYELNTVFLQMELLLARKDTLDFLSKWQEFNPFFEKPGLKRYKIYMDSYLARYYKEISDNQKAIELIAKISKTAKVTKDFRFLVYAQSTLAQVYMKSNPKKALRILLKLEQYDPNPNPHLELKSIALNLLGRKVEALALMIEAKQVFNEAWKAENEALLEELQQSI